MCPRGKEPIGGVWERDGETWQVIERTICLSHSSGLIRCATFRFADCGDRKFSQAHFKAPAKSAAKVVAAGQRIMNRNAAFSSQCWIWGEDSLSLASSPHVLCLLVPSIVMLALVVGSH